jgi:peptide/nickel transport system substrate-binding protein
MGGSRAGPMAIAATIGGVATLKPLPAADVDPAEPPPAPPPVVNLRGERAGLAIARFRSGHAALVLGGRFTDLPLARAAALPRDTLRFDPVSGLFGLAFAARAGGLTADPLRRRALSMAIDRDRIAHMLAVPGWIQTTSVVALGTPEIARPVMPDWTGLPLADRQAQARAIVAGWRGTGKPIPPLRVALPDGPGARQLFGLLAADWRAIGLDAVPVDPDDESADLRLIDEVAPADVASFYLRAFACERGVPCSAVADAVLIAARETPSLAERQARLAQADAMIDQVVPFIPLGAPVRWSLVAPTLDLYRDSPRGLHPLNELRSPFKR